MYIHTYIHTYISICTHTKLYTCIRIRCEARCIDAHLYVCTYVCMYVWSKHAGPLPHTTQTIDRTSLNLAISSLKLRKSWLVPGTQSVKGPSARDLVNCLATSSSCRILPGNVLVVVAATVVVVVVVACL